LKIQKVENRKNLFLLIEKKKLLEIIKMVEKNEKKCDLERKWWLDNIYVPYKLDCRYVLLL